MKAKNFLRRTHQSQYKARILKFNQNVQNNFDDHHYFIQAQLTFVQQGLQMRSGQILNALNAQSHRKHAKSKLQSITEQSFSEIHLASNEFSGAKLPEVIAEPPQFMTKILESLHKQKLIPEAYENEIKKVRKQREKNVYLAYIDSQTAYLSQLITINSQKNSFGAQAISDVLQKRFNLVTSDLQAGKLLINRERIISTKEQADLLNQLDRARLLKIKDGSIRSKLELLNERMSEMEKIQDSNIKQQKLKQSATIDDLNKKIADNLDIASYSLKSEKTKIASDYVKHMSEQRRELKKRQKLRAERYKKIELQREVEMKEAEQMRDLSKKQEILSRIEQKRRKREIQEKEMEQKQASIEKFLAAYRKEMPIFKRKEKQFVDKYVKPENKYREEKLKQIKEKKKSYSLNDIVTHQKKYEQLRKKEEQKKSLQKQMYHKSLKINTKQHYRGSIHEIVEQVDKEAREKNLILYRLGRNRQDRMHEYSKSVLDQNKPKVDEKKRKQLLKSLEQEKMKKEKLVKKFRQVQSPDGEQLMESFFEKIPQKNRYSEGNKFMEYAKMKRNKKIASLSMEIAAKNEAAELSSNVKVLQADQSPSHDGKNAEQQIWQIRSKQLQNLTSKITSPQEFERIKQSFANLDDKAMKKQQILKMGRMSLQEHLGQKNVLDQFYIESIKNKMKLLDD